MIISSFGFPLCRVLDTEGCVLCYDSLTTDAGTCDASIDLIEGCEVYLRGIRGVVCAKCSPGFELDALADLCLGAPGKTRRLFGWDSYKAGGDGTGGILSLENRGVFDRNAAFRPANPDGGSALLPENPECLFENAEGDCEVCQAPLSLNSDGKCSVGPRFCQMNSGQDRCLLCLIGAYMTPYGLCEVEEVRRFHREIVGIFAAGFLAVFWLVKVMAIEKGESVLGYVRA